MPRITVFNQKGGVGKTTTALNLTAALARAGEAPLAIDLDPQGHLTALSGVGAIASDASLYAFFRDNKLLADILLQTTRKWSLLPAHLEMARLFAEKYNEADATTSLATGLAITGRMVDILISTNGIDWRLDPPRPDH